MVGAAVVLAGIVAAYPYGCTTPASDQYRIILMDVTSKQATGIRSYEVTSFTPGEPDASLFQPPPNFEIDEPSVTK